MTSQEFLNKYRPWVRGTQSAEAFDAEFGQLLDQVRAETRREALKEAENLAARNPGCNFECAVAIRALAETKGEDSAKNYRKVTLIQRNAPCGGVELVLGEDGRIAIDIIEPGGRTSRIALTGELSHHDRPPGAP